MLKIKTSNSQKGQTIIILLLIMLVALSIGLAITQRSVTDLSSSNNTEESARAFSAAEAGLEEAMKDTSGLTTLNLGNQLGNQSTATVKITTGLPLSGQALEYPPIGKDSEAQFWLADCSSFPNCTNTNYIQPNASVTVYFGKPADGSSIPFAYPDTPAIEINVITRDNSGAYKSNRSYWDPLESNVSLGRNTNGFKDPNCTNNNSISINTSISPNLSEKHNFRCSVVITMPNEQPIIMRARILYSNLSQPIALAPSSGSSLPPQAKIYTSTGSSGQTQRTVQVFRLDNVVPAYFDFSIFSASQINK